MKNKHKTRKTRAHKVLFTNDLFKPKCVELKTRYRRKPKHCKRDENG